MSDGRGAARDTNNHADQPRSGPGVTALLLVLRGPAIWAAHFTFVYAYQSTACTLSKSAPGEAGIETAIWSATAIALALIAVLGAFRPAHENAGAGGAPAFNRRIANMLALLSAAAIVAVAFVTTLMDPCASLR